MFLEDLLDTGFYPEGHKLWYDWNSVSGTLVDLDYPLFCSYYLLIAQLVTLVRPRPQRCHLVKYFQIRLILASII